TVDWQAEDPDTAAAFELAELTITWGDATADTVALSGQTASGTATHVYGTTGAKTIVLFLLDRDNGSDAHSTSVEIHTPPQTYQLTLLDATDHRRAFDGTLLVDGVSVDVTAGAAAFEAFADSVVRLAPGGTGWRTFGVVREVGPNNLYDGPVIGATLDDRRTHVNARLGQSTELVLFVIPTDEAQRASRDGWNFDSYRDNLTLSAVPFDPDSLYIVLADFPHMGFGPATDPNGLSDWEHDITQVFYADYTPVTDSVIEHYQTVDVAEIASQTLIGVQFHTKAEAPAGRVVLEWKAGAPRYTESFDYETGHKDFMKIMLRDTVDYFNTATVAQESGNAIFLPYEGRNEGIMMENGSPSPYMRDAYAVWTVLGPLPRGIWVEQYVKEE
ncbi:MAG: hypothetical protein ACN0LA_02810, partial [Candidatus Longimicrobiales bacterium M2_2A_002]